MDKIKAMEAFARVVDTGGFTSAAQVLKSPKATVSTYVQELEAMLGVRLLNRTTRRVTVTADGAAYYERCVRILEDLREAEEALSSNHASPSGCIRVDISTSMASRLLVPALPSFFERYPGVELELSCSDRSVNLVSENLDCAMRAGEITDQSLIARRIGTMHAVTCAAPAYLTRHGVPRHPRELTQHAWINYVLSRTGRNAEWEFTKDKERIVLKLDSRLAVSDANVLVDSCLAGLGITQLPSFVFNDYFERGELEMVLGEWLPDPTPVHVVFPSNRNLSTKVRVFVEWAAETFAEHTGLRMCAQWEKGCPRAAAHQAHQAQKDKHLA